MTGYTILVCWLCYTFSFIGVTGQGESCVTPRNERGSCIPIRSCDVLYQVVQQRPVIKQNVDHLRKFQCGFDGNTPKVCCPAEKSIRSGEQTEILKKIFGICDGEEEATFIHLHETLIYQNRGRIPMWLKDDDRCTNNKRLKSEENCTTRNKEEAECIFLYSCPVLIKALATHDDDDDTPLEFIRKWRCGGTPLEPMVCCGSLSNFSTSNSTATSSNDVKNELLPDRRYCGYQHYDDYPSTKNNTRKAGISEFPWLAALVYKTQDNKNKTGCGGSLISNRYVLTAAQCLSIRFDWSILIAVRLGEYNVKNQTDCVEEHSNWHECSEPPQDFAIAKGIVHPQYTRDYHPNDIALLRLERTVVYSESTSSAILLVQFRNVTDYIRPICLPTPETRSAEVGDIFTTTGWGWNKVGGEEVEIKKRILGRLISNEECVSANWQYKGVVTENHFCTIELDSDTEYSCYGDSGGPVLISHRNQWQQEGIISFGSGCHSGNPDVNTKISRYLDWIKENIEA